MQNNYLSGRYRYSASVSTGWTVQFFCATRKPLPTFMLQESKRENFLWSMDNTYSLFFVHEEENMEWLSSSSWMTQFLQFRLKPGNVTKSLSTTSKKNRGNWEMGGMALRSDEDGSHNVFYLGTLVPGVHRSGIVPVRRISTKPRLQNQFWSVVSRYLDPIS